MRYFLLHLSVKKHHSAIESEEHSLIFQFYICLNSWKFNVDYWDGRWDFYCIYILSSFFKDMADVAKALLN